MKFYLQHIRLSTYWIDEKRLDFAFPKLLPKHIQIVQNLREECREETNNQTNIFRENTSLFKID